MKKTKSGAFVIILITFLLGMIAGYAFASILSDAEAKKERPSPYGNVSEYIKDRLNLSAEQASLYDELVKDRREKMSVYHKQYRASFREQADSLRNEIRTILDADQLQKYEEFLEEFDRYRKEQRKER
jgi:hypothetical protein